MSFGPGEQVELLAQRDELPADRMDRRPVVLAEVGNGLEVRREPAGQPHQLDVALAFPLQAPARGDAVEVTVQVDLEQGRGMTGGPAPCFRHCTGKTERNKIKLVNVRIDGPDWIVLVDIIVQTGEKKRCLSAPLTFHKPLHACLRQQA